ncbi:MAG: prohibitin family protein [Bacteroidales bacterium]|nr:prohibitin family protein [Bacteroidales bacterium]
MKAKNKFLVILFSIIGIVVLFLSFSTIVTLQPGEKGVIFKPWTTGLDKDHIVGEGVHLIAPWNKIIIYDVKEQVLEFSVQNPEFGALDVLDENGLTIHVEVTVRFYPEYSKIGYIMEQFGDNEDYVVKLVIPEVRSTVRRIMGQYNAEEIYSTNRHEVEERIIAETEAVLSKNYITMTALLIRSISIPDNLILAIENKLTKQQEALAYQYVVEKEQKEKERKIIQAQGIAEYNRIVSESMTDRVLTYEGIQATLELAKSENAKIVIVGSGDNGLPIILNNN